MAELVRHRQTKGSATDRLRLNHRATPRLHIAFRLDGLGVEAKAVLVDFQNTQLPKNMGEPLRGVVATSQEISIPCRTIRLFRPQFEEQRAFQNETSRWRERLSRKRMRSIPYLTRISPKSTLRSRARFASFWRTEAGRFFGAGFVN
jgi:hypothetical protein